MADEVPSDMEIGIRFLQGSPGERRLIMKLIEDRVSHFAMLNRRLAKTACQQIVCKQFRIDFEAYEKFRGSNG